MRPALLAIAVLALCSCGGGGGGGGAHAPSGPPVVHDRSYALHILLATGTLSGETDTTAAWNDGTTPPPDGRNLGGAPYLVLHTHMWFNIVVRLPTDTLDASDVVPYNSAMFGPSSDTRLRISRLPGMPDRAEWQMTEIAAAN